MTNEPYQPGSTDPEQRREELLTAYLLGELDHDARMTLEADCEIDDALAARRDELASALSFVQGAFGEEKLSDASVATILDQARLSAGESRGWHVLPPSVVRAAAGLALLMGVAFVAQGFFGDDAQPSVGVLEVAMVDTAVRQANKVPAEPELDEAALNRLKALGYLGYDGSASTPVTLESDASLLKLSGHGYVRGGAASVPQNTTVGLVSPSKGGSYRGPGDQTPPGGGAVWSMEAGQEPSGGVVTGAPNAPAVQSGSSSLYMGLNVKDAKTVVGAPAPNPSTPNAKPAQVGFELNGRTSQRSAGRMIVKRETKYDAEAGSYTELEEFLRIQGEAHFERRIGAVKELTSLRYATPDPNFGRSSFAGPVALSPAQFEAVVDERFKHCCILPGESARDMHFRYWGEHPFVRSTENVQSTFAADADTSSYTLARRYLKGGRLPERDAVRTEEFVNYFRADKPAPHDVTFGVHFDLAPSTFNADPNAWMLRVTVRGKDIADFERKPLALTFVVDVSGSMEQGNRMGLVKEALALLATELSVTDSIALIKFSNMAEQVIPMTTAANRGVFEDAIVSLSPGGGTNVEQGLLEGYRLAAESLVPGAVNRVVFLSDGVGNIGEIDQKRILEKVEAMRSAGVYLNTIGVGMGNHNDAFLEQLANKGDGVANYIDSREEAERVMVYGFTQTFQPIARDVKIQVEFDDAQVSSWRQLGYENRAIANADFRNDVVDAGELNAGHQVTALYEVIRTGGSTSNPLATCRLRWKEPHAIDSGSTSAGARQWADQVTERVWRSTGGEAVYDVNGATFGMRRAMVAAQLAECLKRSRHARGDSFEHLGVMASALVMQAPNDVEVRELAALILIARPLLERERSRIAPATEVMDQIAEQKYLEARIEQIADASERGARSAAVQAELDALSLKLRETLATQYAYDLSAHVWPAPTDTLEQQR